METYQEIPSLFGWPYFQIFGYNRYLPPCIPRHINSWPRFTCHYSSIIRQIKFKASYTLNYIQIYLWFSWPNSSNSVLQDDLDLILLATVSARLYFESSSRCPRLFLTSMQNQYSDKLQEDGYKLWYLYPFNLQIFAYSLPFQI